MSQNYSENMQEKYDGQISSEEQINKGVVGDVTFLDDNKGSTGDNYFKKLSGDVGMSSKKGDSTNMIMGDFQMSHYNDADSDATL